MRASGRFVKQEQWERWRAKRKLVSGSKHLGDSAGLREYHPPEIFEIVYAKSGNLAHFLA